MKNKLISPNETEFALCPHWTVHSVIFKNASLSPLWFQEFYSSILQVYIRWIFRPVMRYKLRPYVYINITFLKRSVFPCSLLKHRKAITLENEWPSGLTSISLPVGSWSCFADPLGFSIIHEVSSSPPHVWIPSVSPSRLTELTGTYTIIASTCGDDGHPQLLI